MYSPHLLPGGTVIESYSPPTNPDQSEDGIVYLDTAAYYRTRLEIERERDLKNAITLAEADVIAAQAKLDDRKYELWKFKNPGGDRLTYLLGPGPWTVA